MAYIKRKIEAIKASIAQKRIIKGSVKELREKGSYVETMAQSMGEGVLQETVIPMVDEQGRTVTLPDGSPIRTIDDVFMLTFHDRTKVKLHEILAKSFIAQHKEEYTPVPQKILEEHGYSGKMTISQYRETRQQEITSAIADTKKSAESIQRFYKQIKRFANNKLEEANARNLDESKVKVHEHEVRLAKGFIAFINDFEDKNKIAESFGQGKLQEYAKYANVPVSVLALHAVMTTGLYNTKPEKVYAAKLTELKSKDPELAGLVVSMTGKDVNPDYDAAMEINSQDTRPRSERRKNPKPPKVNVPKRLIDVKTPYSGWGSIIAPALKENMHDFQIAEFLDSDSYEELNQECAQLAMNAEVTEELAMAAEGFATDIETKNNRAGQQINAIQQDSIEKTINFFASQLSGSRANLAAPYNEMLSEVTDKQFDPKNDQREMLKLYPSEFAMITNNVQMIDALQRMKEQKIRLALVGVSGKEERQQIVDNLNKEFNAKQNKILEFNKKVMKLIESKEEIRICEYSLGELKYAGLSDIQSELDEELKPIIAERDKKLEANKAEQSNKNLAIINNKKTIDEAEFEINDLIPQIFVERLKSEMKGFLSNPIKESEQKLLDAAVRKLATKEVSTVDGKSSYADLEREYVNCYVKCLVKIEKERSKNLSKETVAALSSESHLEDLKQAAQRTVGNIKSDITNVTELSPSEGSTLATLKSKVKERNNLIAETEKLSNELAELKTQEEQINAEAGDVIKSKEQESLVKINMLRCKEMNMRVNLLNKIISNLNKTKETYEDEIPTPTVDGYVGKRKIYQKFENDRTELYEETEALLNEANRDLESHINEAFDKYDLVYYVGGETEEPTFKLVDNPKREGAVSELSSDYVALMENREICEGILNDEKATEEEKENAKRFLREYNDSIKEINETYLKLTPEQKNLVARDVVRIQRYHAGEFIVIGENDEVKDVSEMISEEEIKESISEIEKTLSPTATAETVAETETVVGVSADAERVSETTTAAEEQTETPESNEETATNAQTNVEPTEQKEYPEDVVSFVDNILKNKMATEALLPETTPERKKELFESLGFEPKDINPETGDLQTAEANTRLVGMVKGADISATGEHVPGAIDVIETTRTNLAGAEPEQRERFINSAVDYAMSKNEGVENPEQEREALRTVFTNTLSPSSSSEVEQTGENNEEQITSEPINEEDLGEIKLSEEELVKGSKQKPKKIEYTAKGCELALKSINKLIGKLETKIKEDKVKAEIEKQTKKVILKKAYFHMVAKEYATQHPHKGAKFPPDLIETEDSVDPNYDVSDVSDPNEILERDAIVIKYLKGAKNNSKTEDGQSYEEVIYESTGNEPDNTNAKKKNKVLHRTLHNLATREMVESRAEELGKYLEGLGIEVNLDNINALIDGNLTIKIDGQDVPVTFPTKMQTEIKTTLEGNVARQENIQTAEQVNTGPAAGSEVGADGGRDAK